MIGYCGHLKCEVISEADCIDCLDKQCHFWNQKPDPVKAQMLEALKFYMYNKNDSRNMGVITIIIKRAIEAAEKEEWIKK